MELPELITVENYETAASVEVVSQSLSPVKELPDEKPAQIIVPDIHDLTDSMEFLNLENHLPSYNVKEKIIIALDASGDLNSTYFIGKQNENISPFYALKSAVEKFIKLKQRLNKNHEFALVLLNEDKPCWQQNFTSNLKEFMNTLNNVIECEVEGKFDLTPLFSDIASEIRTYSFFNDPLIPPPYVVRVVLLYGRSNTIPVIDLAQNIKDLLNCPYFFLDVLVSHDPVSEANNCKKIFQVLQNLDVKGYSYFFNVGRNIDALMRSVVKLAGHPLQRPIQILADYSL